MTWSVINEIGIDYAPRAESRAQQRLCFPTFAARSADGEYLIGDELGTEKQVPFRFECRTIRLAADGTTLFDTMAEGMHDAFGCLLDDGAMAVLRRTKWELQFLSPRGALMDKLSLATLSKRMPRYVAWTPAKTFLIVFFNRSHDVEIVEVDRQGRLLWCLPAGSTTIGIPGSVQLTEQDTLLIADPFRHVVLEMSRKGKTLWQFGEPGDPAAAPSRLSSPTSARILADGGRLIADTRNHRLLTVGRHGASSAVAASEGSFCDPQYAEVLANGHYLVCDTGNARVVQLDQRGKVVWQYGQTIAERRWLSYPRSVAYTGNGRYLVADTAHDRVIEIQDQQPTAEPLQYSAELFWPRCVRELPTGSLLVADARNHRILEMSTAGRILRELTSLEHDGERTLKDPHDVRQLRNGHLLIADSPRDVVLEVNWSGVVHRVIGGFGSVELDDPHCAQELDGGGFLIADTGHHRIVFLSPVGRFIQELNTIRANDGELFRLHQPRYAEVSRDGTLVIADTGNNRILAATLAGKLIWEFSHVPNSPLPSLDQPRWAQLVQWNEVVICDHFHHRIVHARFQA